MAQSSDYKALVYVYLFGGNDSFNMVTPKESVFLRTRYEEDRGLIALPVSSSSAPRLTQLLPTLKLCFKQSFSHIFLYETIATDTKVRVV